MALKTVLDAALKEKIITPEMKQALEDSLFTLTFDKEDMQIVEMLLHQLVAGTVQVVEPS